MESSMQSGLHKLVDFAILPSLMEVKPPKRDLCEVSNPLFNFKIANTENKYMKKSLIEKLKYIKNISETALDLEYDINNLLNENENFSNIIFDLKAQIKEKTEQNNKLINELNSKNEKYQIINNQLIENKNSYENVNAFTLGINNISVLNNEAIHDALSYFNKKCPYCEKDLFKSTKRNQYEIDHFFPVVKGGQDFPWNILPVCQSCNRKKKDVLPNKFLDQNTFQKVSFYLDVVHKKYLDEAIDSYVIKEKIKDLIINEKQFVSNHINSKFISTILYLAGQHNIINEMPSINDELDDSFVDETTTKIIEYLNRQIPENWENLNINERRSFLNYDKEITAQKLKIRKYVCIAEIWCECFGKDKKDMNKYETRELNAIMKKLKNWNAVSSTKKFHLYGTQRFYERKNT